MPRSVLARSIASWGYPAAYVVVLLSFTLIWFRHFPFLYIGRDAALSLWLWQGPGHDQHAMAINPYFNPAVWIFQTGVPQISKEVVSFIVYFIEVTLSSFALGVALGFSRRLRLRLASGSRSCCFLPSTSCSGCKAGSRQIPPTATRWR